ncbi:hypothetical protein DFH07DRAFT_522045 [Mycena maculata]|uniref:Uncharacterized protein n=1 Tax=Mycena maculata TaxID=230809 RepID=A0AAD7IZB2_9AGAR|nr:hypothetical protein DFH07DRAFT_522045 [Mycena maculata]
MRGENIDNHLQDAPALEKTENHCSFRDIACFGAGHLIFRRRSTTPFRTISSACGLDHASLIDPPPSPRPPPPDDMAAFQTDYNPWIEERLRLWYMEKKPEFDLKLSDMKRDCNAALGQRIRDVLRQRPDDHQAVRALCRMAEAEEVALEQALKEGVEVEAQNLRAALLTSALDHLGEPDPTTEVRERIKDNIATTAYCSPVLAETLFWEGMHHLPNTHRKRMELDFPDRVDALLDFHCIAFHADVNVLKELYDEDLLEDVGKKTEILARHRAKMEAVMVMFAEDMKSRWAEETERLRSKRASAEWQGANDWILGASPPAKSGMRKRAHIMDPPNILGSAERGAKRAQTLPLRGILKNKSVNAPVAPEGLEEEEFPGSFFLNEIIDGEDMKEPEHHAPYPRDEIVLASHSRPQFPSASQSHYEIFHPSITNDDHMLATTPRAVNNVARLTQRFEERMEKAKGRAKFVN